MTLAPVRQQLRQIGGVDVAVLVKIRWIKRRAGHGGSVLLENPTELTSVCG